MKNSLASGFIRGLLPRVARTAFSFGKTFGPAPGGNRASPQKLIMGDIHEGCYNYFSIRSDHSFKGSLLEFSNNMYSRALEIYRTQLNTLHQT